MFNYNKKNVIKYIIEMDIDCVGGNVDKLNLDWITEQARLHNIKDNYFKEPMKQINIFCIFINNTLCIDNIKRETYDVIKKTNNNNDDSYTIPHELILKIIQTHKMNNHTSKFKLTEILTYIIDINPEDIQSYVDSTDDSYSERFLHTHSNIITELTIPETIFIFHKTNSIYFIFKEPKISVNNYKSILKIEGSVKSKNSKITKKVRIDDTSLNQSNMNKYTRKQKIIH